MDANQASRSPLRNKRQVWGKRIISLVVLAAIVLPLPALIRINGWSLAYVRTLAAGAPSTQLLEPPPYHFSGDRWQAESLLAEARPRAALTLLTGHNDPLSLHTRAKAHSMLGEVDDALAAFQAAGDWRSIRDIAHSLETAERLAEAEVAYQVLVSVEHGRGTLELAQFLNRTDRRPEAITLLQRAVSDAPHSPYAERWVQQLARWQDQ